MRNRSLADFERRVRRPIIVLGAGRSGTSLIGRLLEVHPEVAFWGEPRPIWMYGTSYNKDHVLGEKDLTPRIARYIDDAFAEFQAERGKARFAEKTPSNCLRIPFIHALYPDCRILHIYRDGRDVVRSTLKLEIKKPRKGILLERMKTTPIWEWPSYLPMFVQTYLRTNVQGKAATYWGAMPRGWKDWKELPPHLRAAHQWKALVESAIHHGRALPSNNYRELRYEDLVARPDDEIDRICEFFELTRSPEMRALANERIDPSRPAKWRSSLDAEAEEAVTELLEPTLRTLEYV